MSKLFTVFGLFFLILTGTVHAKCSKLNLDGKWANSFGQEIEIYQETCSSLSIYDVKNSLYYSVTGIADSNTTPQYLELNERQIANINSNLASQYIPVMISGARFEAMLKPISMCTAEGCHEDFNRSYLTGNVEFEVLVPSLISKRKITLTILSKNAWLSAGGTNEDGTPSLFYVRLSDFEVVVDKDATSIEKSFAHGANVILNIVHNLLVFTDRFSKLD